MSNLRDKLDKVFSAYVRRRDCGYGRGRCITCGRPIRYENCDAGHYMSRRHTATRWNEYNCHAQCRACNREAYGRTDIYRQRLVERYGAECVDKIERLAHTEVHLSDDDYRKMIEYYNQKKSRL